MFQLTLELDCFHFLIYSQNTIDDFTEIRWVFKRYISWAHGHLHCVSEKSGVEFWQ